MRRLLPVVAVASLLLGACQTSRAANPAVVASFYPLAEVASRVGGPGVTVRNLTPPGAEPHDLELTPRQVDELLDAEVVLYLGHGFQPAVSEVVKRRVGRSIDLLEGVALAPGEKGADPHVWLDPVLMQKIVSRVRDALAKSRPADAATYDENAQVYGLELSALNDAFTAGLTDCPRREIVTSHAAFGYLAGRYGLTQKPISGLSPEAEPDPKRLAELADLVRRDGVTTIFTETLVSPKVAETLAREAGVRVAVLNPIEGLTKREQAIGKTYATVMRDNLAILRAALGCS